MANLITVENTRFIFNTNFAGDPRADKFRSDERKGNIVLPEHLALELRADGFNVRETLPREGDGPEFEPEYYIVVKANYGSKYPPKIYMVAGEGAEPVLLHESSLVEIDRMRVKNVNVVLNPYENPNTGKRSLYIRTMYVEQAVESDPFAARYARPRRDADLPF